MNNKNLEEQWREEFEELIGIHNQKQCSASQVILLDRSDDIGFEHEYNYQDTALAFGYYLAARKKAEEEIDEWKKCTSDNEQFWQFKRTEFIQENLELKALVSDFVEVMQDTSMRNACKKARELCEKAEKYKQGE